MQKNGVLQMHPLQVSVLPHHHSTGLLLIYTQALPSDNHLLLQSLGNHICHTLGIGFGACIHCLLIFTDLLDCVDMFNSLQEQEGYNDILLFIICILISSKLSLCIFHVPSTDNCITDALSCHLFDTVLSLSPGLKIHHFQPPRNAMGLAE